MSLRTARETTTAPPHSDSDSAWDVFVSYSRLDAHRTGILVAALRERGLRVFLDDSAVDDFASISSTIAEALAGSKVLLALYSAGYPHRRACQWELTYAYLAGQREGDPRRRTLVVNPEATAEHVHPMELRDARHWPWPTTPEAAGRLALRVAEHASALPTPMGGGAAAPFVRWLPAPARTGSTRFAGRLTEQWHIHTALHRHRAPLVSGGGTGHTAQVRGMPGIGKSLLAQEYALRFSTSFPGGVFWFDLHDCWAATPYDTLESYTEQVATVAAALELEPEPPAPAGSRLPRLLSRLAVFLGEHNTPCLWVVDGVPDGLSEGRLHLLRGPHLLASTLITTRSLRYSSFGEAVDMPPLPHAESLQLLTSRHAPRRATDQAAAPALVHDVGGHPQALDLLAGLAAAGDFAQVRNRLHAPGSDILSVATPHDHRSAPGPGAFETPPAPPRRSLTAELLSRPLTGGDTVDDVLRLFALACPAPLERPVLENVLIALGPYDPWESAALVSDAVETLLGSGALRPDPAQAGAWSVHPLLARAVRRHDTGTARQEDLRRILLHSLAVAGAGTALERPAATPLSPAPAPMESPYGAGPRERAAAFDLQIELVTRVGVQPLAPDQGSLREAVTSLHSLFATARAVLHSVATETPTLRALPLIASSLANQHLRPFLSTWHPALQAHEATRSEQVSAVAHESGWTRATEMRAELDGLREPLTGIAKELAGLCGVDLLPSPGPDRLFDEPVEGS